jgi:hypothetical protein
MPADPELGVTPFATPITGPIQRHRWTWSGGLAGLPGYSTFYAQIGDAQGFVTQIKTFMDAWNGTTAASMSTPAGLSLVPDPFVDQVDATSGQLLGSTAITPPSVTASAAGAAYAAPSGACVTWLTGGVVNGKRVRGRTFLVPLVVTKYDSSGTLLDTFRTNLVTASQAYITGAVTPLVWHRPISGVGGQAFPMTSFTVKDRVAMLTSRR